MNVLFMNRDSGGGVEFEGNIFIDILKRTVGIDSIDIYKSQCRNYFKNFDFSVYDLIILNDIQNIQHKGSNTLNVNKSVFNINFGGRGNRSRVIDILLDLNLPYTFHCVTNTTNHYPINFISGNIWNSYNKWKDRSNDILYIARLCESKILPSFLDYVRSIDKKIDFYGMITDKEYYNKNKDVINYKGYVNHIDLLKVYNNYKNIYLFSSTECLSMTLREAILCGTVPIVFDDINYTKAVEDYIIKFKKEKDIYNYPISKNSYSLRKKIDEEQIYLNNYFSFDKMILDFIFYLRGLLLRDFKFNKNYRSKIKVLQERQNKGKFYASDSVNWDNVKL